MKSNPEFVIYTGPMFGGKSRQLLNVIDRSGYQSRNVLTFKPKLDHRYADESIVTHSGDATEAIGVSNGREIFEAAQGCDVVAVDEAFMIDDSAEALISLFKMGKSIYVSTIQLSARGEVFPEVQAMLPWATEIKVCPAVCTVCYHDAYYTVARVEGLNYIDVGGSEKYEPRCHQHTTFLR